jgi:hypothetical protein
MSQANPDFDNHQERRTQLRIRVRIPVSLTLPGRDDPLEARCEDLSWGGALLDIAQCLPIEVETLRIELCFSADERLSADARVLRVLPRLDGHYLLASRFTSLGCDGHARLESTLRTLWATGAADRSGPEELARELEVVASDQDELREMLEQVGRGALSLTVFDAYEVGQSISLTIAGADQGRGLRLRALVRRVRPRSTPGFDWARLYTLTLGLEHPRQSLRGAVSHLLTGSGETIEPRTLESLGPHLLSSSAVTTPRPRRHTDPAGLRSALEVGFPEALNHLLRGWGDAQAFEPLFRDLVLGDGFQLGGWPPEVWEELTLLQDVHDLAYGVPSLRTRVLADDAPANA